MKLFFTVQLDALPLKLTPSASVDSMTLFSTVQLLLPNCSHMPTLVSWIHSPLTVQPLPSEPSMAFAVLSSCRPTVLDGIQTASEALLAAVIAWLNAEVESLTPVGSAP